MVFLSSKISLGLECLEEVLIMMRSWNYVKHYWIVYLHVILGFSSTYSDFKRRIQSVDINYIDVF